MNVFIYILIFVSKILENALGTMRMILVSNSKKQIGAILQFIIALIWILSTSIVLTDISEDPFKIVVFCLGSYVGSLFGCIIEEKLAIGYSLVFVITNIDSNCMIDNLRKNGYPVTNFNGQGEYKEKCILMTLIKRKSRKNVFSIIKECDKNALIIAQSASTNNRRH